jgi:hypothetical protein
MIYYESITSDMEEQVKYIKSFQEETAWRYIIWIGDNDAQNFVTETSCKENI